MRCGKRAAATSVGWPIPCHTPSATSCSRCGDRSWSPSCTPCERHEEAMKKKMMKRGFDVLRDKTLNRSITFSPRERDRLGLRGLLPYSVATPRQMVQRVIANLDRL